jgi:hypothetical protein
MEAPRLRLVATNGQREPDWQLTLERSPRYAHRVDQLCEL